jgi:ABC-type multidrug transport system, ATPase component
MKKRFSIAESMLGDPRNMLFDETLNGLDPEGVVFVRNLIMAQKKKGKAVLLSSHILSEVESISDRVAIISHGKLLRIITRSELQNLGKPLIRIRLDNPDDNVKSVLSKFGDVLLSGNEITVTDLKIQVEEIPRVASELVSSGYAIRLFEQSGESLEEFFFKTIGEN